MDQDQDDLELRVVSARNAHPTRTGVRGGMDVDITVALGGREYTGGVTLVPDQINGGWTPYGESLDHWISDELVNVLQRLDEEELRVVCREIEGEASDAIRAYGRRLGGE